jgi:hypothetical protein
LFCIVLEQISINIFKINETVGKKGVVKKQTGPQVPIPQPFIAVMESAKSILDNKEEIPDPLMAQLIKAKLLHIKAFEKEKEIQRAVSFHHFILIQNSKI